MNNSSGDQVCLEYLMKVDLNNTESAKRDLSKFLLSFFEDSHASKFSIVEKDSALSKITIREYWREREEFQKSIAYNRLLKFYDSCPDESLLEPIKITFRDDKIGQFSIWF